MYHFLKIHIYSFSSGDNDLPYATCGPRLASSIYSESSSNFDQDSTSKPAARIRQNKSDDGNCDLLHYGMIPAVMES